MGALLKQVWLCHCVDRMYGKTCWVHGQRMRQGLRQAGSERWASLEQEHLMKPKVFSRHCWRRIRGGGRTAVGVSFSGVEDAWLASVRVSVRGMPGSVTNPKGGSSSGRGRG